MSDIGLYSGFYQQIHEYTKLLDQVLSDLKKGIGSPEDEGRRKLSDLLIKLVDEPVDDLPTRLIFLQLQASGSFNSSDLAEAGQALRSPIVGENVVNWLEYFAQTLGEEQARAMARVRRWTR